jgi:hypothetical protein
MTAAKLFAAVQQAKSVKQEVETLELLEDHLLSPASTSFNPDVFEEDYLQNVDLSDTHRPETSFPQQELLNQFVCYVFVRRFGWSEAGDGPISGHTFTEQRYKLRINESLGNILHW